MLEHDAEKMPFSLDLTLVSTYSEEGLKLQPTLLLPSSPKPKFPSLSKEFLLRAPFVHLDQNELI